MGSLAEFAASILEGLVRYAAQSRTVRLMVVGVAGVAALQAVVGGVTKAAGTGAGLLLSVAMLAGVAWAALRYVSSLTRIPGRWCASVIVPLIIFGATHIPGSPVPGQLSATTAAAANAPVVGGLIGSNCHLIPVAPALQQEWRPSQLANAQTITRVATIDERLPARAAVIAVATAIPESGLENVNHGDVAGPDSRGLFQQRPSQGWGTQAQVMDPVYATRAFLAHLVQIPNWEHRRLGEVAEMVQRSSDYSGGIYDRQEPAATKLVAGLVAC